MLSLTIIQLVQEGYYPPECLFDGIYFHEIAIATSEEQTHREYYLNLSDHLYASLEKHFNPEASFEEAVKLTYKALKEVGGKITTPKSIVIYYVSTSVRQFTRLTGEEVEKIVKK